MTLREDLEAVAALLEPEGAWITDELAQTRNGKLVRVTSPQACRFCLVGAIYHATGEDEFGGMTARGNAVYTAISDLTAPDRPVTWNDTPGRTQAEVVALVRRAAEAAS